MSPWGAQDRDRPDVGLLLLFKKHLFVWLSWGLVHWHRDLLLWRTDSSCGRGLGSCMGASSFGMWDLSSPTRVEPVPTAVRARGSNH